MADALGCRERKKEQTRRQIEDTARRLFRERGFDRVTIAQIAGAADVAEQTVYNYFPTKEDLVYRRLESFEEALLQAIRDRAPGEDIPTAAFGRWLLAQRGMLAETPVSDELKAMSRMIAESPALRAREQQVFARYTQSLAELIAHETGAEPHDVRPQVMANALLGIQRALVDYTRTRILAGAGNPGLARDVRAQAEGALAALERGFRAEAEGLRSRLLRRSRADDRRGVVQRQPPAGGAEQEEVGRGHLGDVRLTGARRRGDDLGAGDPRHRVRDRHLRVGDLELDVAGVPKIASQPERISSQPRCHGPARVQARDAGPVGPARLHRPRSRASARRRRRGWPPAPGRG